MLSKGIIFYCVCTAVVVAVVNSVATKYGEEHGQCWEMCSGDGVMSQQVSV